MESDVTKLEAITTKTLIEVLGLTIKLDEQNKLLTFLTCLSAYTESSQINISFNAPSSSGKSFIPTEIARLFPQKDVIEVGYCSPTAFFHDYGIYDKEKQGYTLDLSRKIIIFLDQPHTLLLQHLRPLLSHDKKELHLKITDKSQKAGIRTKNIFLLGFPTVIFCTAGLNLDEQEATRFLLLSPEINQDKIREAIYEKIKKETNPEQYEDELAANSNRRLLIERIKAIKIEHIDQVTISSPEVIEKLFFERITTLKPRHQRDIARVTSLIKVFALLNLWFRNRNGSTIEANEDDIREAFAVWDVVAESQELNLPPYVYDLFKDVIVTAFNEKNRELQGKLRLGITRQEIHKKHSEVYGRMLPDWQLRQQIIPLLELSGLINQEKDDPIDKRKILIYPTIPLNKSKQKNNSELGGGDKKIAA